MYVYAPFVERGLTLINASAVTGSVVAVTVRSRRGLRPCVSEALPRALVEK